MRSNPRIVLAAGVALAALATVTLAAPSASAFCRTSTLGLQDGCTIGGTECCTVGKPLYWKNACVGYSLQKDASRQVSLDDAESAITTAFTKWTGTTCPTDGTGTSRASVDVRDLGAVNCGLVQYNKDGPNQHVIAFRDSNWPHNDSNNTLALTTVTFDPNTGEIYDADMEINTAQQHVTVHDPIPADGFDFASIVTHETGHFLGLAHSTDGRATMYAHYKQGAIAMRNLTADDVSGICTIYPPNGTRTADQGQAIPEDVCDPTPRHGFTTDCASPSKSGCGSSSIAPTGVSGESGAGCAGISMAGLGLVALLRRTRRRGKDSTR